MEIKTKKTTNFSKKNQEITLGNPPKKTVKKAIKTKKEPIKKKLVQLKQDGDRQQFDNRHQYSDIAHQLRNTQWSSFQLTDEEKAARVEKIKQDSQTMDKSSAKRSQLEGVFKQAKTMASKDQYLKEADIIGIGIYTSAQYRRMNSLLRGDYATFEKELLPGETVEEAIKSTKSEIELATAGLNKLPPCTNRTVYRGAKLTPEKIAQCEVGKVVTEDAFVSTTTSKRGASGFIGKGDVIFEMYSKNGKEVMPYSQAAAEPEVLFAPGTKFKVLEKKTEGGKTIIRMTEVDLETNNP